jgi:hypothetical protein
MRVVLWFCVSCAVLHTTEGTRAPSPGTTMSLTKLAPGPHSQIRVLIRLSGSPKRPADVWSMIVLPRAVTDPSSLSRSARFCPPTKKPGAIALTRVSGVSSEDV